MLHVTTTQSLHVTPFDLILLSSFQSICLNVQWYRWKFTLLFWPLCSRMIKYWLHLIPGWIFFLNNFKKNRLTKIEIAIFGPKIDWNRSIFDFQNRANTTIVQSFILLPVILKPILRHERSFYFYFCQVAVLEALDDPGRQVLVATVHQYFHPKAPHVRALQTIISIRHIEHVLRELDSQASLSVVEFIQEGIWWTGL